MTYAHLCRDSECRSDRELSDKTRTDVDVGQSHDGLVTVVVHRQLETFSSLGGVAVVVGLQW